VSTVILLVAAVVVAIDIPILLFGATQLYTAIRLQRNDPLDIQAVRQKSDGVVEFSGTAAELSGTVDGKYSGEECLAYGWERQIKSKNGYTTDEAGTDGEPFLVQDGTGEIAVDPTGATVYGDTEEWDAESNTKQVERRINVGDELHIYGHKQDIVERQDGIGTESQYVGSITHEMGRLDRIRARPHLIFGHVLGFSSDLHITLGSESDAVKQFAFLGAVLTSVGFTGLVMLVVVLWMFL